MRQPLKNKSAGVTLLELMVTLAVLGILVSVSVPGFTGFRETQRLIGAAEAVYGRVQQARSESIARNTPTYVNFSANGSTTWAFGISSFTSLCDVSLTSPTAANACVLVVDDGDGAIDPGDGSVDTGDLVLYRFSSEEFPGVTMSYSGFSSGSSQIEFDPRRGMATSGQVDLQAINGDQLRVKVTLMGRTVLCSPDGSVAKYSSAGC